MNCGVDYTFHVLQNQSFVRFESSRVQELLKKWDLLDRINIQAFSFDQVFKEYLEEHFIKDFFSSQNVVHSFLRAGPSGSFVPLGIQMDYVKFKRIPATHVTLELFESLKVDDKIVRSSSGAIVPCLPVFCKLKTKGAGSHEAFRNVQISNNLHWMLLADYVDDDDDEGKEDLIEVLSDKTKEEFLFKLLFHVVIGGPLCQYEDTIHPYSEVVKALYKDLISVRKIDKENGDSECRISSFVYAIYSATNETCGNIDSCRGVNTENESQFLFQNNHINNFLYLIIDPVKQVCYTLYHHVEFF